MPTNAESNDTNDRFNELAQKVSEAQVDIKAALNKSRDELVAQVDQAQTTAEQQADRMNAKSPQKRAGAEAGWKALKEKWHAHLAKLHRKAEDRKAEHDASTAQVKAEMAEGDAYDAVDFALGAVQEAEYAVLYAVLVRSDADALTDSRSGSGS